MLFTKFYPYYFMALTLTAMGTLTGCQNTLSCLISGDNLKGRITFGSDINISRENPVLVEFQYGTSFSNTQAVSGQYTLKDNIHGLLTFDYSLCVDNDRDLVIRAYQDGNANHTLDSGESSGIHDGTSNGNATPTVINIPQVQGQWKQQAGVDISIDTP